MDISLLREYIALSQTLNYTKAAEMLHLTQPTLSKHIVSMEKELGCSLLERDRRNVKLTDAGNIFAAAAIQMIDAYDEAQAKIGAALASDPIKVSGVIMDSTVASIISIASTFLDSEGHTSIIYADNSDRRFIEQLLDDEIDIALSFADLDKLDELGLSYIPLVRSQFVALVSLNNPLSRRKSVSIDDLRNYRFVKYVDRYAVDGWANIEQVCRDHGFTPRTRTILGRSSINYCATPLGVEDVSILQSSMSQLRYLSDFSRVAVIPVTDDDAVFRVYALYKKENYEHVKPVIDAYAQARKVIINHGKSCPLVENE